MSYLVVEIDEGGLIRPQGCVMWEEVIHRQSRNLEKELLCHDTLAEAAPLAFGKRAIAELNERGAVKALWCRAAAHAWWEDKLKIWNGCYGSWPLRQTNH